MINTTIRHPRVRKRNSTQESTETFTFDLERKPHQPNWNLDCWFLWREENRRTRRKALGARRELTTTQSTYAIGPESNQGHIGWRRAASLLPSQTAIQLQRENKTTQQNFIAAHPQFVFDTFEVILSGLQIGQREVESLACVIFARGRSLDMKHSAVFTADEHTLWRLVKKHIIKAIKVGINYTVWERSKVIKEVKL